MQNNINPNDDSSMANQEIIDSNMPSPNQPTPYKSEGMNMMSGMGMMHGMGNHMVYPEVFYKLQPFIMMVCDEMDTYGYMMPTQAMAEQMTDYIYDDVCRMYPELAEYVGKNENKTNDDPPTAEVFSQVDRGMHDRNRGMLGDDLGFGRRFRRRGLFRDLIDILFISELFSRRRRHY